MNRLEKIIFVSGITISTVASIVSLISGKWSVSATQLGLSWFMFLYYKSNK